jgi:hypothetical protein
LLWGALLHTEGWAAAPDVSSIPQIMTVENVSRMAKWRHLPRGKIAPCRVTPQGTDVKMGFLRAPAVASAAACWKYRVSGATRPTEWVCILTRY